MATAPRQRATREIEYPTGDGKPMAETEVHRDDMIDVIGTLKHHFADDPKVHVSGNLLLYYEKGNRRKHVSPDVMVTFGVPREPKRDSYLVWKEGKAPDVVIEITSKSTRREDKKTKKVLYRDVLEVTEYFQFDRPRITSNHHSRGSAWWRASTYRSHWRTAAYPVRFWDYTWSETGWNFACSIR